MISIITAVHNQLAMNKLFVESLHKYSTMPFELIIIDNASSDLNKTIAIEFVRSIQTAAGRMLFAKKVDVPSQKSRTNTRVQKVSTPPKNRRKKTAEDSLISLVENQ